MLETVFDGKNVDRRFGYAIVDPIVFVSKKYTSDFGSFEVGKGFVPKLRMFGKRFYRCGDILFPCVGIVGVELARNVFRNGYEALASARRPID